MSADYFVIMSSVNSVSFVLDVRAVWPRLKGILNPNLKYTENIKTRQIGSDKSVIDNRVVVF